MDNGYYNHRLYHTINYMNSTKKVKIKVYKHQKTVYNIHILNN